MTPAKPTIALVPGAWHSPMHYEDFLQVFQDAGYPTKSITLPGAGSVNPRAQSVRADACAIRENLLLPLLEDGKDVILIMHSYGGCPGSAAALGLSKEERSTGGGIIGLVFIAAFLAQEGDSLLSALGGKYDSWVINDENGQLDVENPLYVFYHDVPNHKASKAVADLKLQSEATLSSPSPPSAWDNKFYDGRRCYIRTLQDHTIPYIAQDMMLQNSGVRWYIKDMDTSHSPFLSRPRELVDQVLEFASLFQE
ncbi:hypothetical protein N7510_002546 [Penicillium lagena]|uniref:uncharacterized protein n=1 Tax=Penicillium lagena TaxID=94218 RepID=UPI0025407DEB|nr:uncharacterized protein N7510_002546 [Penicillium lagena]KAJ5626237.1 hypothetical protein N7510_002546 [Penicillium lagena]